MNPTSPGWPTCGLTPTRSKLTSPSLQPQGSHRRGRPGQPRRLHGQPPEPCRRQHQWHLLRYIYCLQPLSTTGDRLFAECQVDCRVLFFGHSAKTSLPSVFFDTRQRGFLPSVFLTLGKEAVCRVFFLTLGKEPLCRVLFFDTRQRKFQSIF